MTPHETLIDARAAELRRVLGDRVVTADDAAYDTARLAWNLAIDQRPFAVAYASSVDDVVDIVRAVTAARLRIAPQSTGHAAGALSGSDLSDAVILNLSRLRGVTVDASARTAVVQGGSVWNDVLAVTAPHGLTALHGSAGDVSVVGYSLSGGVSFYARAHGLGVGAVRSVSVVTAEGSLVRASADENSDLFWALRGGSGAFGVVVALELDLLPYGDVFAGMLLWDASRAEEVGRAWAAWTEVAPESATTTLRVLHLPPLPELPPFLSGRSVAVIDGAILETDAAASDLLAPLRALQPEIDTFARIPSAALVAVHMDPPAPTPAVTAHAVLSALPGDAIAAFVTASSLPGLLAVELRHLGGALSRAVEGGGAVSSLAGEHLVHAIAVAPVPEAVAGAEAAVLSAVGSLDEWSTDSLALTFIDSAVVDRAPGFGSARERLRSLKRQLDPADVFVAAQPV